MNNKCIICNNETYNENIFCSNCYKNIKEKSESLCFLNYKTIEDYYFFKTNNQIPTTIRNDKTKFYKDSCFKETCNLYSIALYANNKFKNTTLLNRVKNDISKILIENKNYFSKELNKHQDIRNNWPREYQCEDGHYVRSLSEVIIDNWLYHHDIVHAYEKKVFLPNNQESIVISDFYIPKGNIYIEYWGIQNEEKYEKRKEEKIDLYNLNKLNLINIDFNQIKYLDDILPNEIGKFTNNQQ